MRLRQSYEVHSGYCFMGTWPDALGLTFGRWAAHHDFHHTTNTVRLYVNALHGPIPQKRVTDASRLTLHSHASFFPLSSPH